jgi:hypothetical protein
MSTGVTVAAGFLCKVAFARCFDRRIRVGLPASEPFRR